MRVDQLERSSPVDAWLLNKHGLFRILISKDEECLYKAIAEQKYPSQTYYEKVKKKLNEFCSTYLQTDDTGKGFESLTSVDEKMSVVSAAFQRNTVLFGKVDTQPQVYGKYGGTTIAILLRYDETDNTYESIHPIEHMQQMAVCQALVYEVLYDKVFNVSQETQLQTVDKVRQKIYNRNQTQKRPDRGHTSSCSDTSTYSSDTTSSPQKPGNNEQEQSLDVSVFPPFPFRVAKSLDPSFYRNALYDIWLDARKDVKEGDKVTIRDSTMNELTGHVQEILSDERLKVFAQAPCGQLIVVNRSDIVRAPRKAPSKSSTKGTLRLRSDKNIKDHPSPHTPIDVNSPGVPGFSLGSAVTVSAVLPLPQIVTSNRQPPRFQNRFQQATRNPYFRASQQFVSSPLQLIQSQNAAALANSSQPVHTLPRQPIFPPTQIHVQTAAPSSAVRYYIQPPQFPLPQYTQQQRLVMVSPRQQFSQDNAMRWSQAYASLNPKAPANASVSYQHQSAVRSFGDVANALPNMPPKPAPYTGGAL